MHLHSIIVSFNRLDLLKQCYTSYKETVSLPHTLVIVDNASNVETRTWLRESVPSHEVLLLDENRFPGYATNRGWEQMPEQTTLLHRSDNDFKFLPGWCEEVMRVFNKGDVIGQVGLRTSEEEMGATTNVGGNNVIRRELWDRGLRYDERPWGQGYPPGWTEDSLLSPAVVAMGYRWTRVRKPCIVSLSREDPSDPYYQRTWRLRGITPPGG